MVDFLIKISGSLFVGGVGLFMILACALFLIIAVKEIAGYIEDRRSE